VWTSKEEMSWQERRNTEGKRREEKKQGGREGGRRRGEPDAPRLPARKIYTVIPLTFTPLFSVLRCRGGPQVDEGDDGPSSREQDQRGRERCGGEEEEEKKRVGN